MIPILLRLSCVDVQTYCEPFAGSAALLFHRPPAPQEVLADVDPALIALYQTVQSPDGLRRLLRQWQHTLYSRAEFARALSLLTDMSEDTLLKAWALLYAYNASFGNLSATMKHYVSSWACSFQPESRHPVHCRKRTLLLTFAHLRLRNVRILEENALSVIPRFDAPHTFFYLDPPYLPQTRKGGLYRFETDEEFHRNLVALILRCKGFVLLSCYDHPIYRPLEEAGFVRREVKQWCRIAVKKRNEPRTKDPQQWGREEILWLSPNLAQILGNF